MLLSLAPSEKRRPSRWRTGTRAKEAPTALLLLVACTESTPTEQALVLGLGLILLILTKPAECAGSSLLLLTAAEGRCRGRGSSERVRSAGGLRSECTTTPKASSSATAKGRLVLLLVAAEKSAGGTTSAASATET